jgi:hypothetical protein
MPDSPHNKCRLVVTRCLAALIVVLALTASLAPAIATAGDPSGKNEYELNLPGDSGKSGDSGSDFPVVPVVIGAVVVTGIAIFLLARNRRPEA